MITAMAIAGCIMENVDTALGLVIFFLLIFLFVVGATKSVNKDVTAWYNRREYWANGGPAQYHKKKTRYTPKLTAPQSSPNQPKVVKTSNGTVTILPDGGCIVERADGLKHYVDKDGKVTELTGKR